MADRFFEVLHLFLRNATVVLRWNVRVDRTSGPDCDLPLPFLLPMPSGSRRPTRRTGLQLALPRLLHAHAPGPSGAFVTKGRNRFSELRHIQLGADMLRRPFRPMQTRTPAKKDERRNARSESAQNKCRAASLRADRRARLGSCAMTRRQMLATKTSPKRRAALRPSGRGLASALAHGGRPWVGRTSGDEPRGEIFQQGAIGRSRVTRVNLPK